MLNDDSVKDFFLSQVGFSSYAIIPIPLRVGLPQ